MKAKDVVLSICCVTYNHEKYIRQCLDGFAMQKTNFAFEVLVHEDASTDGTAAILRAYEEEHPELFRVVYQTENQFLKQNTLVNILFPMAKGKYIALCEGDDYWTDPYKLQKQVDILEADPHLSACYHNTMVVNEMEGSKYLFRDSLKPLFTTEDTFSEYVLFHTSSLVLRVDAFINAPLMGQVVSGDMALISILSSFGPLALANGAMSVYRKNTGGITETYMVISKFHQDRIVLMRKLNRFHHYRYYSTALKTIKYHRRLMSREMKLRSKMLVLIYKIRNLSDYI